MIGTDYNLLEIEKYLYGYWKMAKIFTVVGKDEGHMKPVSIQHLELYGALLHV